MHLGERYAVEVDEGYVHFLCKKTGAEVFALVSEQFKELMVYKEVIAETMSTLQYKDKLATTWMKMLSLNSTYFQCHLNGRVKVSVNPESPHHLHLVNEPIECTLDLTKEEFGCLKWFDGMLKYYQ